MDKKTLPLNHLEMEAEYKNYPLGTPGKNRINSYTQIYS